MFAIYKLRWLNKNRPEMMGVKRISFISDFVTYSMLGADHICDYSLPRSSGMFDFRGPRRGGGPRRNCRRRYIRSPAARTRQQRDRHAERRAAGGSGMPRNVKLILRRPRPDIGGCGQRARVKKGYRERHGTVDCLTAVMKKRIWTWQDAAV